MDREELEKIVRKVVEEYTSSSRKPSADSPGISGKVPAAGKKVTVGTSGKPPADSSRVTIGSAGKIFSAGSPAPAKSQAESSVSDSSITIKCPLLEGTVSECQGCAQCVVKRPEDVKAIIEAGACRISALHPGEPDSSAGYDVEVAKMIDHTILKANVTQEQVGKVCEEAKKYGFASVCINPAYVSLVSELLKGSPVKVTVVVGFPLGATTKTAKAIEARDAVAAGADEIDMVINVGALKSGNYSAVLDDIKAVREVTAGHVLKVIIETALLTEEEKIKACELAKQAGADFVKTSTGFSTGGATVEDIKLMRKVVGPSMGIKASGGIHTLEDAMAMKEAGATRIGASASVKIVTGEKTEVKDT